MASHIWHSKSDPHAMETGITRRGVKPFHLLGTGRVPVLVLLGIHLNEFVSYVWKVHDNFLLSHILNSTISIALHRVVILVYLNTQLPTSGEVIWLWHVSQTMVLHGF